jgi:arsenate reductase (glutaredoxin)
MSNKILIFHNPQCSKSREALDLLHQSSCEIEVVEYLKNTPSKEELEKLIKLLGIKPVDLVRKSEEIFKTMFKDKKLSDQKWIEAMVNYPKLIERPIVINDGKAVIGRPPSLVLDIIS